MDVLSVYIDANIRILVWTLFRGMASREEEIGFLDVQILVQAGSRIVGRKVSSSIQSLKAGNG